MINEEYLKSIKGIETLSKEDFTKALGEMIINLCIDLSTKCDFTQSDFTPNAFIGFLGKTEDGKAELAKKETVKAFDINKSMKVGGK